MTKWYDLLGEGVHDVNGKSITVDLYKLKKTISLYGKRKHFRGCTFLCFACSWAFAELKMEGRKLSN